MPKNFVRFHLPRLSGRQISELLGFCKGLVADGKITQNEAEALHAWLVDQRVSTPLAETLRTRVRLMLEDEVLDTGEGTELMRLVRGLIDDAPADIPLNRSGAPVNNLDDHQISTLLGLCRGLIADGKMDQNEEDALRTWLMAHEEAAENPVMKAFREKLKPFLENDLGDASRAERLLRLLSGLIGGKTEVGECLRATTLWVDDPPPKVIFKGRKFCLTGKFSYGRRCQCEDEIRTRYGICQKSPTRETDYLIVGSYAEGTWIQSAYGRKIEKAVSFRASGLPIRIVSETHWVEAMA